MDLEDIFRKFYPNIKKQTFISATHETFSKIIHVSRYKVSLKQKEEN